MIIAATYCSTVVGLTPQNFMQGILWRRRTIHVIHYVIELSLTTHKNIPQSWPFCCRGTSYQWSSKHSYYSTWSFSQTLSGTYLTFRSSHSVISFLSKIHCLSASTQLYWVRPSESYTNSSISVMCKTYYVLHPH